MLKFGVIFLIIICVWMWIALIIENNVKKIRDIDLEEYKKYNFIFIPLMKNMLSGPFLLLKLFW